MTVPVSVNGHSTETMSMPSEFNIAITSLLNWIGGLLYNLSGRIFISLHCHIVPFTC